MLVVNLFLPWAASMRCFFLFLPPLISTFAALDGICLLEEFSENSNIGKACSLFAHLEYSRRD